ncbi:layilin-like [Mytilus trossulus]|uniref:layilin-like n=1 Tax=Mytilus trossulus TaxID=6551 RepID=UPI003004B30E
MQLQKSLLISFVLFINGVTSSLLAFTNVLLKRNEAQHCCHKHGMTLMAIKNEKEQKWMEEKFLPVLGESGTFWIGVFSDDTTTDVYDASKQVYTWSNWYEPSLSSENNGTDGSVQFNSTVCVTGDLSQSLKWVVTNCDERHPYVCQTFDEAVTEAVDVGDHNHVSCPEVLKYRSNNLLRDGNVKRNGSIWNEWDVYKGGQSLRSDTTFRRTGSDDIPGLYSFVYNPCSM